jgi:hypothetical protein
LILFLNLLSSQTSEQWELAVKTSWHGCGTGKTNHRSMITLKGVDPRMIANNLESSNLMHPGEMIKDEIESRGMT